MFAAPTLLFGLFDLSGLLLGIALAAVTWGEFDGARRLRRMDLSAPRRLALNQALLFAAITIYAGWSIYTGLRGPGALASATAGSGGGPEVDAMLAPYKGLERTLTVAIYGGVIAASALAQGLTALYYASRRKFIEGYLTATPQWVRDVELARNAA